MPFDNSPHPPRSFRRKRRVAIALLAVAVVLIGVWAAKRHFSGFHLRRTVALWVNPAADGSSAFSSFPIEFSRNGRFVAARDHDYGICILNASTGNRLGRLSAGVDSVAADSYVFSADGQTIVAAGYCGNVYVWDVSAQEVIRNFALTDKPVVVEGSTTTYPCWGVMISKDGSKVVSGDHKDGTIQVWNVETGEPEVTLSEMGDQYPRSFSDRGNLLAVASDGELSIWDVSRSPARRLVSIDQELSGRVDSIFSSNERILATVNSQQEVMLWDCRKGTLLGTISPVDGTVASAAVERLAFCLDDSVLVTGLDWRTAPWWTAITGSSWLFESDRGCVRFWDVANGEELESVFVESDIGSIAVSADGTELAIGSWEGTMTLWTSRSALRPRTE